MIKSYTKSLQNTDRIRTIIYVAVKEFRIRGAKRGPQPTTMAALDQYAEFCGFSRSRLHSLFYNRVFAASDEADLDRASRGFVRAMIWLAVFFRERAEHCERLAYAEGVAIEIRERNRGKANCEPVIPAQQKFAA